MTSFTDELSAALQASPLGAGLSAAQLTTLAEVVRLATFKAGDVLAREGRTDDHLVAVVEGTLNVVKGIDGEQPEILATLKSGRLAHELGFLDGSERYASLVATEATRVLLLERAGLEGLIERAPQVLYHVMCAIVRSAHLAQTRMAMQASELTNYIVKQHGRY
ncbi:MAG TPA: cyclic nucleotide-binding domain-containing protein [Burkholderiaceae bacterium]|nr:cyclic nucleotide-binding domain-containing protein [Burkholderiaceae bacterium]